jgi:hypothetical protein
MVTSAARKAVIETERIMNAAEKASADLEGLILHIGTTQSDECIELVRKVVNVAAVPRPILPETATSPGMDLRVRAFLEQHKQECFVRRRGDVVSFDYFRNNTLLRRETYIVDEQGRAVLVRVPARASQPRYRIDE